MCCDGTTVKYDNECAEEHWSDPGRDIGVGMVAAQIRSGSKTRWISTKCYKLEVKSMEMCEGHQRQEPQAVSGMEQR